MFEGLYDWFLTYGIIYALIGMFIIFVIDAMIFPALPELFAVGAFLLNPVFWWGVTVLITAAVAEVVGNSLLYALVKRKRLPKFIRRTMKKWIGFLFLKDERIILMNRIAPVIPFTGAFIATCKWSYKKSMIYLVTGGVAKYSLLLLLVGMLNVKFDRDTAQWFTIAALIIIIGVSFASSYIYRKRIIRNKKESI